MVPVHGLVVFAISWGEVVAPGLLRRGSVPLRVVVARLALLLRGLALALGRESPTISALVVAAAASLPPGWGDVLARP